MQIIKEDMKAGEVQLRVDSLDDLWYLSQLIDEGDMLQGRTLRKVKTGRGDDAAADRRPVYLEIRVEKVEWSPDAVSLRVGGIITQGPDDVPHGSHHTFALEPQSVCTLRKEHWLKHQRDRLRESAAQAQSGALLVVFDREEVFLARLKKSGIEMLAHEKGVVQKKDVDQQNTKDFFERIVKLIEEYEARFTASAVVVASASFWKDELLRRAPPDAQKRWIMATVSDVSASAFNELLRRPEVSRALASSQVSRESVLVDGLLVSLAKGRPAAYGLLEVSQANAAGAVETLLISTQFIRSHKEKGSYAAVEVLMRDVESKNGEVHLISSQHDGGKRIDGLGGIAAMLRFAMG